jgi:hypothetical protein
MPSSIVLRQCRLEYCPPLTRPGAVDATGKWDDASPSELKPAHILHHFYRDPTDDVLLQSSDAVFFRTSSYRLSKSRWVRCGVTLRRATCNVRRMARCYR